MSDLKYPIGEYRAKKEATPRDVAKWIDDIMVLPEKLKAEINGLTDKQLDTPYRENGWSPRQVIHHIADSHINGYTRIKLALTEDRPAIKTYEQDQWAELADIELPIEVSLNIIRGLHERWTHLLKSLDEKALTREIVHPKSGTMTVKSLIGLYAWHGKHHLSHIKSLKERENWT